MVFADRSAIIHCVEAGNLVHSRGGHFENPGYLVHDADAGEAVLALAEVEKGHDGSLLVLRRVSLEDLVDDGLVLRRELEHERRVIVGRVAMLTGAPTLCISDLLLCIYQALEGWEERTTASVSLCRLVVLDSVLIILCGSDVAAGRPADRTVILSRNGTKLDAIFFVLEQTSGYQ